jgi:hypothetical protein
MEDRRTPKNLYHKIRGRLQVILTHLDIHQARNQGCEKMGFFEDIRSAVQDILDLMPERRKKQ